MYLYSRKLINERKEASCVTRKSFSSSSETYDHRVLVLVVFALSKRFFGHVFIVARFMKFVYDLWQELKTRLLMVLCSNKRK